MLTEFYERAVIGNGLLDGQKVKVVTDELGKKLVVLRDGTIYSYINNRLSKMMTGERSKKLDGYTVAVFNYIDKFGSPRMYRIKQHVLVAFCYMREEFDKLFLELNNDRSLVVNHMNCCHWANNVENLEWVPQQLNVLHGKMAYAIMRVHPDMVIVRRNQGDTEFKTLARGFSAYDLLNFLVETHRVVRSNERRRKLVYSDEEVSEFIKWLDDRQLWK